MITLEKTPGKALESETIQGSFYISTIEQPNPGFNKMEIFKDIPDYEGYYQISNLGRIKSLQRFVNRANNKVLLKEKIIKLSLKTGYPFIALHKNGIIKEEYIHRLMYKLFIGEIKEGLEINHKNGIKTDSYLDNLEVLTRSENVLHAFRIGLNPKGEHHGRSKLSNKEVNNVRELYKTGNYTYRKLAKKFNVALCTIHDIINNITWKI